MTQPTPDIQTRPCKSCGAKIFFAKTVHGKTVPLDAEPEKRFALCRNTTGELVADLASVYTTHFQTCPDAEQHRKDR